jgi:hypothetical protein
MEYTVPAMTVRITLESLQQVSGGQYKALLSDAGLGRFANELPPAGWEPVATGAELTHLYGTMYRWLGEGQTRMFLRNYGRLTPDMVLETPMWQEVIAAAPQVPAATRLRWFVDELARLTAPVWTPLTVTEDEKAIYISLEYCPICAEIRGVSAPICADGESFCGRLAQRVTGERITVTEVECVALGAPHCKYALYKK